MVKIERVLDSAIVTINRDGKEIQLFQGQLISYDEVNTLKVLGGKLIYSIDETEVVEVIGIPAVAGTKPSEEIEKIVTETVTEEVKPTTRVSRTRRK